MKKQFVIAFLLILVYAVSVSTVLAETPLSQSFDTVGGIVTFGRYEQDGSEENGPQWHLVKSENAMEKPGKLKKRPQFSSSQVEEAKKGIANKGIEPPFKKIYTFTGS